MASQVVRRIFTMAAGTGQIRIAKALNDEHIPCPSEYKRLMGERYTNNHKLDSTRYWTYATVHRILQSQVYIGTVVSGRHVRPGMHTKAKAAPEQDWIVVEGMHEPIISRELWDTVQAQISANARPIDFEGNVSMFASLLPCRIPPGERAGPASRRSCPYLEAQTAKAGKQERHDEALEHSWAEQLVRRGELDTLDRATIAQTVKSIRVFEDKHIEMTYLFSNGLNALFESEDNTAF